MPTVALVHVLYLPFADDWGHRVADVVGPRNALGLEPVDGVVAPGGPREGRPCPGPDTPRTGRPRRRPAGQASRTWDRSSAPTRPCPRPDAAARPEPNVLISLSTTLQGQRAALPPILEAMRRLPVRGLLSLGGALPVEAVQAPPNVDVVDYVPHAAVLPNWPRSSCHGGLSTVTAALAFGVPLVCIPQGREQPLNAERVEAVRRRTVRLAGGGAARDRRRGPLRAERSVLSRGRAADGGTHRCRRRRRARRPAGRGAAASGARSRSDPFHTRGWFGSAAARGPSPNAPGDHVDVDVRRAADQAVDERAPDQLAPSRPQGFAHHQLRDVLLVRVGEDPVDAASPPPPPRTPRPAPR